MNTETKYYVYILTNKYNGTLYIGITNDLEKRIRAHKQGLINGFTKKYNLKRLIYYEAYDTSEQAILREKRLKHWKRAWKIVLIEENNKHWRDLSIAVV